MAFICKVCSKSFKAKRNLIRHDKFAHISKRFFCHACCQLFARKDVFSLHERKYEEDETVHTWNDYPKILDRKEMLKQQTIFCRANTRKSNREISMIVLAQKSIKSCSNRLSYIGSPAEEDDSNPCKASEYAFKGKLKKIELLL